MPYENNTGLPSPSDILRPWIETEFFTEESRIRGTAVHGNCACELLGKFTIVKKEFQGYVDSFRRWRDQFKPEPLIVERRLISKPYGYCGQPDLVAEIVDRPAYGVVDFKTSAALGRAWPLQLAGYQHLAQLEIDKKIGSNPPWGCAVRLKADGKFPLVTFWESFDLYFSIFLGALNVYRHFNT